MNLVGTRYLHFGPELGVARHESSFLFILFRLSSAQSAVAQGNLLYMFALANTQSVLCTVAIGNVLYMFALANTQSGADGHVSGTVDYDIFGEPVTETGVFASSSGSSGGISALVFAYAGKPYNPVTGLSDYGFRDYASGLARFTTVDPIRDGSNWYAYCNSDPVNYVDAWGLECPKQSDKEAQNIPNIGPNFGISIPTFATNGFTMTYGGYYQNMVDGLVEAQNIIKNAPMYQAGAGGPFGNPSPTWCNISQYDVMEATSFHTEYVYGDSDRWNTRADMAYDNLHKASQNSATTGIIEVGALTAQIYANKGFTVAGVLDENGHDPFPASGHIVTVRPDTSRTVSDVITNGPTVMHIGENNGVMTTRQAFGKSPNEENNYEAGNVHFFVDTNQPAIYKGTGDIAKPR